jgi:hypothetical protein
MGDTDRGIGNSPGFCLDVMRKTTKAVNEEGVETSIQKQVRSSAAYFSSLYVGHAVMVNGKWWLSMYDELLLCNRQALAS